MTLKECIAGPVTFLYYRSGELVYKTQNGFVFSVPTDDTSSAVFNATDKGIFFMRWIRKALAERSSKDHLTHMIDNINSV